MRRFITTLLASGLANIASAHTLDSEHRLAESLWHQVMGSHHLPITLGLIVCAVMLFLIRRQFVARYRRQ